MKVRYHCDRFREFFDALLRFWSFCKVPKVVTPIAWNFSPSARIWFHDVGNYLRINAAAMIPRLRIEFCFFQLAVPRRAKKIKAEGIMTKGEETRMANLRAKRKVQKLSPLETRILKKLASKKMRLSEAN
jgi:hypothetical protein